MKKPEQWNVSELAYDWQTQTMPKSQQVLITHVYLDHVMRIARPPNIELLAPKLKLNLAN